ncbi:MAG: hypothetical protein Phog2KO_14070 [Phototrophicaceae bacterium]
MIKHIGMALILVFLLSACGTNAPSEIAYADLPETGDSANGEILYREQTCIACHIDGATGAPSLSDYAERAGTTVAEQDAREYTFYSIVEPAQHIAEGYGNAMPNTYDNTLTSQEIADLIAYLLDT